jgi:hypothetical protein
MTPTKEQLITDITAWVAESVPDVMKLQFGCEVRPYVEMFRILLSQAVAQERERNNALRAKELGELREKISGMADPYPVEVFPEPWNGWQKDIDELAKTKGRRIDCISADYSRWQRKLAKEDTLRIVDELIDKPVDFEAIIKPFERAIKKLGSR